MDIKNSDDSNLGTESEDIKSKLHINEDNILDRNSKKWVFDWTITILITLLLSFLLKAYVIERVIVSGSSMDPTLEDSEYVLLYKLDLFFKGPDYNDIVVFQANKEDKYIKRVIGLSGDTIEIKDGILYRNGESVEETYLNSEYSDYYVKNNPYGDSYFTNNYRLEDEYDNLIVIPEGSYFVLGDNRPVSNDSRKIGVVTEDSLLGVVYNFW